MFKINKMNVKDLIQSAEENSTPFYYYDMELLGNTLDKLKATSDKYKYNVHYALKANTNGRVLDLISSYGFGADCVSGNEIGKAVAHGFCPDQIAFAGVGKTDREIEVGLENDIFCFNCESMQEIEVINEIATREKKIADIALRVNPNVDANTHKYITTGRTENKFGILVTEMAAVVKLIESCKNVNLIGLHFHIGSQVTDLIAYRDLCLRVNEIQNWFDKQNIELRHINVGGGLGIDYDNPDDNPVADFESFFSIFHTYLKLRNGQELHFELGRSIVGVIGNLISKELYIKEGASKSFAILDAGMTELIRPALYNSKHKIENLSKHAKSSNSFYDVVGPICESSDCFGVEINLPTTTRGDIIAIRCAGAYGEVMASNYNLREKPLAVYTGN